MDRWLERAEDEETIILPEYIHNWPQYAKEFVLQYSKRVPMSQSIYIVLIEYLYRLYIKRNT